MSEKIIRDPVHDVIAFRTDRPGEALLFRLLNAPEFQRLRRIHQLGLASLAYPGADHSRYSHSLGVMETTRKILNRLGALVDLDEQRVLICLVAALLHDLGHGPFSHVFERVSAIHHEEITRRMILDTQSRIQGILAEFDADFPRQVVDFLDGIPRRTFYNDLISSPLDADRFDYLLRDNLMTGSQYGGFDLNWLVQSIAVDEASDRLVVSYKGTSAVENYLQSRYHMYRHVYFHKVVRSAEGMVKLALQRARRLAVQDRLPWPPRDHAVHKALLGLTLTNAEFMDLDDISMLTAFKLWVDGEDQTLAGLCQGLLFRRLYKVIDISHIPTPAQARDVYRAAEQAVAQAGGDSDYDLFLDEPTPADSDFAESTHLLVRDPHGRITDFATTSPLVAVLSRQLFFRRIHVLEQYKETILKRIDLPDSHSTGQAG